jgi:hypothetical protein
MDCIGQPSPTTIQSGSTATTAQNALVIQVNPKATYKQGTVQYTMLPFPWIAKNNETKQNFKTCQNTQIT